MNDKVIVISPQYVTPLNHGAAIRIFNLIGQISDGFHVTLVVSDNVRDTRHMARARGWNVHVLSPAAYQATKNTGRSPQIFEWIQRQYHRTLSSRLWRNNPFNHTYVPLYGWHALLEHIVQSTQPSAVIIEHVWHIATLAHLRRRWPNPLYILDAHNVESKNLERYLESIGDDSSRQYRHLKRQHRHIRKVESSIARYIDAFWACSESDCEALTRMNAGMPGKVVPNGVDVRYFAFDDKLEKPAVPELVYTGVLSYASSEAAILYFYNSIWPLLKIRKPNLKFSIVGRGATRRLKLLAEKDNSILLASSVPDVRPYLRRAAVSICPIQAGSGTRLKILEAMSIGTPVVSTSLGAEGIQAEDGTHLFLADNPQAFARAILNLLEDKVAYERMRRWARMLVETQYDWDVIGRGVVQWMYENTLRH